jgi:UDP-N-acetylmuramoyl-tripeptide--D-alanyl-D-alanine ligase
LSWTCHQLAAWCNGELVGDGSRVAVGVSTDSRTLREGELFVAIRGDSFDGHDFVEQAVARGAAALLVSQPSAGAGALPVICVDDTLAALGALAHGHRFDFAGPVVAITGSNGKTTTKEMCAEILASAGARVHRTPGNLNNQIGLPLSLLALPLRDDAVVLELGMNHEGEIDALARIASPTVGAITQVAPAHLGPLGSIEAIARAKGELYARVRPDGTVVVNADDPRVVEQARRFSGRKLRFGRGAGAEFRAEQVQLSRSETRFVLSTPAGATDVALAMPGEHLVEDALCAAAAAWATELLGGDPRAALREGLGSFAGVDHRLTVRETRSGLVLLDDSYNANPASVAAALRTLCGLRKKGRALAVLGDMFELGDTEAELHAAAGREAARLGIDVLIAVGERSRHAAAAARREGLARVEEAADAPAAAELVRALAREGDAVLIKGSRGMRMERAVSALLEGGG